MRMKINELRIENTVGKLMYTYEGKTLLSALLDAL